MLKVLEAPAFPSLQLKCFLLGDSTKLEQHLVLLREEYVKLQQRYKTLEKNYQVLTSTSKIDHDSFVYRLLKTVADLFNRELYR